MPTDYDANQEQRPPQHQPRQPGIQAQMEPQPVTVPEHYAGSSKLEGKRALVTGGDSGIGRAVAIAFAREGALLALLARGRDGVEAAARDVEPNIVAKTAADSPAFAEIQREAERLVRESGYTLSESEARTRVAHGRPDLVEKHRQEARARR